MSGHRLYLNLILACFYTLIGRPIDLIESILHKFEKSLILFISPIDQEIHHLHYLRGVIPIFLIGEKDLRLTHQIVFDSALIIYLGKNGSEGDVRGFYLGLRILPAKKLQNIR